MVERGKREAAMGRSVTSEDPQFESIFHIHSTKERRQTTTNVTNTNGY